MPCPCPCPCAWSPPVSALFPFGCPTGLKQGLLFLLLGRLQPPFDSVRVYQNDVGQHLMSALPTPNTPTWASHRRISASWPRRTPRVLRRPKDLPPVRRLVRRGLHGDRLAVTAAPSTDAALARQARIPQHLPTWTTAARTWFPDCLASTPAGTVVSSCGPVSFPAPSCRAMSLAVRLCTRHDVSLATQRTPINFPILQSITARYPIDSPSVFTEWACR